MQIFLVLVLILIAHQGTAKELTCKKVTTILAQQSSIEVRPYCDLAETRCKSLSLLEGLAVSSKTRQDVEAKLRAEVLYQLQVCNIAIDAYGINVDEGQE